MPWVRFDDQFPIHRKTAGLSDAAFRLHVSAIFWCARNLTDGFLLRRDLEDVCARVRTPERFVAELVVRGLWHLGDEQCPSKNCIAPADPGLGDGWVIHDYLEYQPARSKVLRIRAVRTVAGSEGGKRSGQSRRASSQARGSKTEANAKQVASGLLHPRTRSSLREEGTGGAPLRGGGAPPSQNQPPAPAADRCAFHMLALPCRGCAADAKAAD